MEFHLFLFFRVGIPLFVGISSPARALYLGHSGTAVSPIVNWVMIIVVIDADRGDWLGRTWYAPTFPLAFGNFRYPPSLCRSQPRLSQPTDVQLSIGGPK